MKGFFERKFNRILSLRVIQQKKLGRLKTRQEMLTEQFNKKMEILKTEEEKCFERISALEPEIENLLRLSIAEKKTIVENRKNTG